MDADGTSDSAPTNESISTSLDTPRTPPRRTLKRTTKTLRIRIQTLREIGWTYAQIAEKYSITQRAVQYACTHPSTPSKHTGRPPALGPLQINELIQLVTSSYVFRRLPYSDLIEHLSFSCGVEAIKYALKSRGYKRFPARSKPPLSDANRQQRLQWAQEHKNWTKEQWGTILWSNETWTTGHSKKKVYVTRTTEEELQATCIVERHRKQKGWMFWGSFAGNMKGPCLFWEKDWGSINTASYQAKIVPLIDSWIR